MVLRLHLAEDNSVIIIDSNDCLTFRATKDNTTRIRFKDYNFDTVIVNESADKIYNMLTKQQSE